MTSFTQVSYRNAFCICWIFSFSLLFYWQANERDRKIIFIPPPPIPKLRPHVFNLTDFGAVGDGTTLNTRCFEEAVAAIEKRANYGGAQLNVGPGRWLTAPFNVTSHMTLFLAQGATIVGSQVEFTNSSITLSLINSCHFILRAISRMFDAIWYWKTEYSRSHSFSVAF
jgi:hypothetical protein